MNILSKISYAKIQWIGTRVELRSALNVLGLMSDQKAEEGNKKDVFKVIDLAQNLNAKDRMRLEKYSMKAQHRM